MHTRRIDNLTIRPLRDGDTTTVAALFERLGEQSRVQRFAGAKPRLTDADLELLSRVDDDHHVLVAYVDGDPEPAGISRLVREGEQAEIAFAVADRYQRHGIGTVLARELTADARAAGIRRLTATVRGENSGAATLMSRCAQLAAVSWSGGEREFVVAL